MATVTSESAAEPSNGHDSEGPRGFGRKGIGFFFRGRSKDLRVMVMSRRFARLSDPTPDDSQT
jgi:hypothetical protein